MFKLKACYQNLSLLAKQQESQRIFTAKQQYLLHRNFNSYHNYIRELSRREMYQEIVDTYRQQPYLERIRFWRNPNNKTVQSWIYNAFLHQEIPYEYKSTFWQKLDKFVFFVVLPFFLLVKPEFEVTIEIGNSGKWGFGDQEKPKEESQVKFKDVIGIDEYKEELQEIVDFLQNPDKYHKSGAKLPKGILLIGRPGTGKTLLARALANEAGCKFIYKSGAEFDEMFVGVGAQRVRKLFEEARQSQPALIFIDEIDSIGSARSNDSDGNRRGTINQILTEMDGFRQNDAIIVIGATNMDQSLDKALTRAGRFDKVIQVMPPDIKGRQQLFDYYISKIKHDEVNTLQLAQQTSGMTGAEIQNIVNLAITNAVNQNQKNAREENFAFAIDRVRMGIGRKLSEQDKELTAYHESGHALTNLLTKNSIPLHKVTILPRGPALGFTSMVPKEDQFSQSRAFILAQIDVAMGGRAAEDLKFGKDNITTGAGNDLAKATELAYMYVSQLGMGNDLISDAKTSKRYDFQTDQQVQEILKDSYERVRKLLETNMNILHKFADHLLKYETVTAEQLKALM